MAVERSSTVAVCLPTYRRPVGLGRCVRNLAQQLARSIERHDLLIVVVDNEPVPSVETRDAVAQVPNVVVLHEPTPGVAAARNTGVRHALDAGASHVAFLDDDEVPSPQWLDELLATQRRYRADLVAGPVIPVLEGEPAAWVRTGRFFDRPRTATGMDLRPAIRRNDLQAALRGRRRVALPIPSTNNLLVTRRALEEVGLFAVSLGTAGGSDREFIDRAAAAGMSVVWADGAEVVEHVPTGRQNVAWLLRRAFRLGNNSGLRGAGGRDVLGLLVAAALAIGAGAGRMAVGLVRGRHQVVHGARTVARGFGILAGILRVRFDEYGRPGAPRVRRHLG